MNAKEIKAEHIRLGQNEPFTKKELIRFTKKDQSMIRNIQILNKFDKKAAIKTLKAYKGTARQNLARIAKENRARLEKFSSAQKPDVKGRVSNPQKGKKQSRNVTKIFQQNRKEVKTYLQNKTLNSRNPKTYARVERASKKYIDASKYELSHGVNSKASQNYREKKLGLSPKYEGRIIK